MKTNSCFNLSAHSKLDRLVEKAYGRSFSDDSERVAFLFEEYKRLITVNIT